MTVYGQDGSKIGQNLTSANVLGVKVQKFAPYLVSRREIQILSQICIICNIWTPAVTSYDLIWKLKWVIYAYGMGCGKQNTRLYTTI